MTAKTTLNNHDFITAFYRQRVKQSQTKIFHYINTSLYLGRCEIAVLRGNIILLNETIDLPELVGLKNTMISRNKVYNYNIIYVPLEYGEEKMPNDEEIKTILEDRLKYYLTNTQELSNDEIRGEYKAYYTQYKLFLDVILHEEVNKQLSTLYKQIKSKEFIKALKLQVARRKANMK